VSLTPSVLLKPPAPASHGKEPPGPPPDTPFATVLDDHQARTAVAEGQQRSDTSPAPDAKRDGRSTGALAALLAGVPLPAGPASAAAARPPAAPASATPALSTAGKSGAIASAAPPLAAVPAGHPVPTGPAVPAAAAALPLGPVAKAAAAPSPATAPGALPAAVSAPSEQAAPTAPALPSALTAVARALRAPGGPSSPTAAAPAPPAASAPATGPAPAARSAPGTPLSGRAAPQAQAQAPAAPAPASAAAPTGAAAAIDPADAAESARGVGLEHAVETVRLALRAAADGGVTHARISLTPRELGAIEVHLRQTADGLVARVVAQHAAAAQLLQDGGADLRRQLEQSGVNLLRLDIGASGEQGGRAADRQALAHGGDAAGGRRRADANADDPLAPLDDAAETTATATLALPNGALVDVLA